MGVFFWIWSVLYRNGSMVSKTFFETVRAESSNTLPAYKIEEALSHLKSYGLVVDDHGLIALNQDTQYKIIFDGHPRRLKNGDWGTSIRLPAKIKNPAQGSIVISTTRTGVQHAPKYIVDVVKSYNKGNVTDHLCSVKHINKDNSQQNGATPPQKKPTEKDMKDFKESMNNKSFSKQEDASQQNDSKQQNDEQAPKPSNTQMKQLKKELQNEIEKTIQEEVEKRVKPMVIEVRSPNKDAVKIEGAHYLFSRLLNLVSAGFNVFMWGPPGTGKTTAALQVAKALSRKAEIDTLDPTTARSMIQGYMNPNGEPVHNVFTRCWENGSVYVADEVDLAPGHVQTLFNSALANGAAPLAWGNVERSEGFSFVATGNTAGRPTAAFPDRRPMSNAFADRLYFLHWPLDPSIECRAVGLPTPPLPQQSTETCEPKDWVTFVQLLREWASTNAPRLSITPRASLLGIQALAAGESPEDVADGLIFRGCDPDLRDKALRNVRW